MATIIKGKNARKPYTVRYQVDGRQREQSFRTKREADDFRAKFEHDTRAQIFVDPKQSSVKFGEAADSWLARHPGTPKTKKIYGDVIRLHLKPEIGSLSLARVAGDRLLVERLIAERLPEKNLGASSIRTCATVITGVVNDAVRGGRLGASRLQGITLPQVAAKADIPFASHEQIVKLASELDLASGSNTYGWTIYLMRGCGLRLGEALGVMNGDVTSGHLRLARQLSQDGLKFIPLKHRGDGDYRDIPCPAYVVEAQSATSPYDAPVAHRKYRTWFNRARDNAGLPATFTPHTLRHIFASTCLTNGIPITDVAKWLGHANIQVTFGIYGHLLPASFDRARQVLDEEWRAPTGSRAPDVPGLPG